MASGRDSGHQEGDRDRIPDQECSGRSRRRNSELGISDRAERLVSITHNRCPRARRRQAAVIIRSPDFEGDGGVGKQELWRASRLPDRGWSAEPWRTECGAARSGGTRSRMKRSKKLWKSSGGYSRSPECQFAFVPIGYHENSCVPSVSRRGSRSRSRSSDRFAGGCRRASGPRAPARRSGFCRWRQDRAGGQPAERQPFDHRCHNAPGGG